MCQLSLHHDIYNTKTHTQKYPFPHYLLKSSGIAVKYKINTVDYMSGAEHFVHWEFVVSFYIILEILKLFFSHNFRNFIGLKGRITNVWKFTHFTRSQENQMNLVLISTASNQNEKKKTTELTAF